MASGLWEPGKAKISPAAGDGAPAQCLLQIREEGKTKVKTLTLTLMVQSCHREENEVLATPAPFRRPGAWMLRR